MITEIDLKHLRRCIELAEEAVNAGDDPFGSVLVDAGGRVLAEERNRINTGGNPLLHPEIELTRWAVEHMTEAERAQSTLYTSGEHCPMCAAAHAWAGLGRIVYASSSEQLSGWLREFGVEAPPVRTLPIDEVVRNVRVDGPVDDLALAVRELHRRRRLGISR